MRNIIKVAVITFGILSMVLLSGCSKLGENEVNNILKNKYKNNLISSTYTVDEKNNFAQAEITIKGYSGKEINKTEYYQVRKKNDKVIVRSINVYGVPQKLVLELATKYPGQFKDYINLYNELDSLYDECESVCSEFEVAYFDIFLKGGWLENWFIFEGIDATEPVNNTIEAYVSGYESAPEVIRKHLSEPPEYYSLTYDGRYYYTDRTSFKP